MAEPSLSNLTDVVWIQTAFLGDIVLSTGAMHLLHRARPLIRQHLVTTSIGAEALQDSPFLNSITVFEKGQTNAFRAFANVKRAILSQGLDYNSTFTLLPHRSARSALLAKFLNFSTITYKESSFSSLASTTVNRVTIFNEAQRVALLLEPLGFHREDVIAVRPNLTAVPSDEKSDWQKEISRWTGKFVAMAPGSNWGTKKWPIEHFKQLAKSIANLDGVAIVILGGSSEIPLAEALANALDGTKFWNLAGRTTLRDLRWLFPKLHLVIANDSAPVHYASAFNVPTLAIFGPTTPAQGFGPVADRHKILEHANLSCRPCSDHGPEICPLGHFRCMQELNPANALMLVLELLNS
jgi:heptosyltransferase-2